MTKKISAEKVQPLLMYPDNLPFLQREAKLPHSSNEIMNNLRTRMGGTIAFEKNPMQGIVIYMGLLILCIIAWAIMIFVANDYFIKAPQTRLFRRSAGRIIGGIIVIVFLGLGGFTWIVSKTLFKVIRYSPTKMKQSYALMLHQGKPIKASLVSPESVNGMQIITYRFTSPEGKDLTCTYRTPRHKYKKGEVIQGKSALVWYLNDTINTLL